MHEDLPLLTDSYKITHWALYPPGTTRVQSYFESRGGPFEEIVFFGLQDLLLRYLAGVRVDHGMLDRARDRLRRHFGRDADYFPNFVPLDEAALAPGATSSSPRAGGASWTSAAAACPCGSAPWRRGRRSRLGR